MSNKPTYVVISDVSLLRLCERVQEMLSQGYKCAGGICIVNAYSYYQALVLESVP